MMKPFKITLIVLLAMLITACSPEEAEKVAETLPTLATTAVPIPQANDTAVPIPSPIQPPAVTKAAAQPSAPLPTDTSIPADDPAPAPSPTITIAPPSVATAVPPIVANVNTAIILDASGSMMADLDGHTRLAVAQDAVGNLSAGMPSSINASLWVYGHRVEQDNKEASCQDIEQVIPLSQIDAEQFDQLAHSFPAKGYTPITDSLIQAAASLPVGPHEKNSIILVSDGEETCGGDPCALAAQLAASDAHVTINAIGLAVDDFTRGQLECIAASGDGTYFDVQDADGLGAALEEAAVAAADDGFALAEGLGRPTVVIVSPDGRHVYVTGAQNETVVAFSRDEATGQLTFIGLQKNGEGGVQGMDSPLGMVISHDGEHIYVSGGDDLTLVAFSRDAATGQLSYVATADAFSDVTDLDEAHGVAISPDGSTVYVVGRDNSNATNADSVAVFNRDAATGQLTRVQLVQNGLDGVDGLAQATEILVSPDGRHVYVSGIWKELAVFNRDEATGQLTFAQSLADKVDLERGLLGGYNMAISPDGRSLYLTARRASTLTLFERDPETGRLTFNDQMRDRTPDATSSAEHNNLEGAHGLALSPDGQNIYVAADITDFLTIFGRDAATGQFHLIQQYKDDELGVDGIRNSWSIAVSPDGETVYVAGFDDDALAVFDRDTQSGALTFIQTLRNRQQ
ncbi:MAG: beta-propeller fold lactonase family protein [Chloroflexi bacterium]|nr:beta-propeller fold lactonase family protein [Chloroflexota bacterium]